MKRYQTWYGIQGPMVGEILDKWARDGWRLHTLIQTNVSGLVMVLELDVPDDWGV